MEWFKALGNLFIALLCAFVLGAYAIGDRITPVEPHQWVLTSFLGLYFLVVAIEKLRKL